MNTDDKLSLITQIKSSTNIALWSSLITINGFLFTLFTIIITLNIKYMDFLIIVLVIPFLSLIFISCYKIYKLFKTQNNIYDHYRELVLPEAFRKLDFPINEIPSKIIELEEALKYIEKRSIHYILINIIYLFCFFIFIY